MVSNGLGAGLVDAPPMLLLIARCGASLGLNPGSIPTVGIRWGDENTELKPNHVILQAWRDLKQRPVMVNHLKSDDFQQLENTILQRPFDYVQVEEVQPSRAPAWDDGHLSDHGVSLRMFATASKDGSFDVLLGGLVRSALRIRSFYRGMRQGGTSKDVWLSTPEMYRYDVPPSSPKQHLSRRTKLAFFAN